MFSIINMHRDVLHKLLFRNLDQDCLVVLVNDAADVIIPVNNTLHKNQLKYRNISL